MVRLGRLAGMVEWVREAALGWGGEDWAPGITAEMSLCPDFT